MKDQMNNMIESSTWIEIPNLHYKPYWQCRVRAEGSYSFLCQGNFGTN